MCGFSCNDASSHRGWIKDIEKATGCGNFNIPLFCDPTRENAVKLGVLDETNKDKKGLPLTVRAAYILKPDKTIALIMYYPASTGKKMYWMPISPFNILSLILIDCLPLYACLGRNYEEIFRVIDSLQLTVSAKLATPVNWREGQDALISRCQMQCQFDFW